MSKYFKYILDRYNTYLGLSEENLKIKNSMIDTDKLNLDMYKKIDLPDFIQVQDYSKRILNVGVKFKNKKSDIKNIIKRYIESINFFEKLMPYLQIVYTIKELGLDKEYIDFLYTFYKSEQYKLYIRLEYTIEKTSRWCRCLLDKT